ncbi:MAG: tRNA uridine-5-carboxymethylaminomethyl(34) synthesis GTPase MnmE [Rikenellaceae bacterium]
MIFDDTIVALSTATGGAINIIRISGSDALAIFQRYFSKEVTRARHSYFGEFVSDGIVVDQVVAVWFAAPNSYTGEDLVEISCHGSRWITNEIIRLLICSGARSANAGEFTRRAYMSGKMNLAQAEAVGDLISSESRMAAQVAMSQMRGGYTLEVQELRQRLLKVKSLLELELDFGDEDVEFAPRTELLALLGDLRLRCVTLADSFAAGNVLRHGVPVAIVGAPNVGKSTLLNCLVGEQRAIVSDIAGTTRDYIEESIQIEGVEFRFIDTAGIRHTEDFVEAIGVERSLEMISRARIVLQLVDCSDFERVSVTDSQQLLVINSKMDLGVVDGCDLAISCHTGSGIEELLGMLVDCSGVQGVDLSQGVVVSNQRHYELLCRVVSSVDESISMIGDGMTADMISFSLTDSLHHLGEITGEFTTDEVLGNIFSSFCIGK